MKKKKHRACKNQVEAVQRRCASKLQPCCGHGVLCGNAVARWCCQAPFPSSSAQTEEILLAKAAWEWERRGAVSV